MPPRDFAFWAKSLRGQKRKKKKIPLTIFGHVFPWFGWWKHIRRCRCGSSFPKVDDFSFLEFSNINQHHSTATNSRRLHVYNSQTEHSGNGCVYGRTVCVQDIIANFGAFVSVRSNCLSWIGSTQRRRIVFFFLLCKVPPKINTRCDHNTYPSHHQHYSAYLLARGKLSPRTERNKKIRVTVFPRIIAGGDYLRKAIVSNIAHRKSCPKYSVL